ncbi:hypothetical protein N7491_001661 [Penicillium cf. griseofulvum]|uniref:Uncharacterized protein n=1 Tax=Penicillium cf. griseofulvum TaxID=2972120 RepID=A0A9W9JC34_9EURO|nr:hypothetical protein N7472_006790 [Penicillium cf. griseofulvum]KAJ5445579.1 hypothetical protein N7491_001661 [Penicillium cf. griseofulvum]KAJ5447301.1 hypothetical protein N7445_002122 [Penicillium cf. griseofulvum]
MPIHNAFFAPTNFATDGDNLPNDLGEHWIEAATNSPVDCPSLGSMAVLLYGILKQEGHLCDAVIQFSVRSSFNNRHQPQPRMSVIDNGLCIV